MAVTYLGVNDLFIYRGDDLIKNVVVNNTSNPTFDYTGTTILFQIKEDTESAVAAIEATPTPVTTTLGTIEVPINIPGIETANLSPGEYVYDIQFTLPTTGIVRTYLAGRVLVTADVSR
jgi:hypothetical protein